MDRFITLDILLDITKYLNYRNIILLSEVNKYFNKTLKNKIDKIKTWYMSRANEIIVYATHGIMRSNTFKYFKYKNISYEKSITDGLLEYLNTIQFKHGDIIIYSREHARPKKFIINTTGNIDLIKLDSLISITYISYLPPKFYENIIELGSIVHQRSYYTALQCWI